MADDAGKAYLLADEWLKTYSGEDRGPLSRYSKADWRRAFETVGFIEVRLMSKVKKDASGAFSLLGEVLTVEQSVAPTAIPRLFRYGTPETVDRWSWSTSLDVVKKIAAAYAGYSVWVCDDPKDVFARIQMGNNGTVSFVEYVVQPGEVRPYVPGD